MTGYDGLLNYTKVGNRSIQKIAYSVEGEYISQVFLRNLSFVLEPKQEDIKELLQTRELRTLYSPKDASHEIFLRMDKVEQWMTTQRNAQNFLTHGNGVDLLLSCVELMSIQHRKHLLKSGKKFEYGKVDSFCYQIMMNPDQIQIRNTYLTISTAKMPLQKLENLNKINIWVTKSSSFKNDFELWKQRLKIADQGSNLYMLIVVSDTLNRSSSLHDEELLCVSLTRESQNKTLNRNFLSKISSFVIVLTNKVFLKKKKQDPCL